MNTLTTTAEHTKTMVMISLMAAVICILGPLSLAIPISPVPISLTNLAVYFTIYVLGTKKGTISYLIYLLIGLIGIPVFSGFTGGPAKLLGPTGGYLIGFIFMALLSGLCIEHTENRNVHFIGMLLGTAVCYLFGTVWLARLAGMSFGAALTAGVIPFIPGDLTKIVLALLIGPTIRARLRKAGFAAYDQEVKAGTYPAEEHNYAIKAEILEEVSTYDYFA